MTKSEQLYERALRVLPGGVSRNAVLRRPHPSYAVKGEGCHVTDLEGVQRIDFANNIASLIHGHAHPAIVEAVSEQLKLGTAFTFATEAEVIFAEHICSRSSRREEAHSKNAEQKNHNAEGSQSLLTSAATKSAFEKVRFVNSGTEAIMCCLKAARAFTGRPKIAKVEGAYHGLYDYAEVSQTAQPANWGDADSPRSVPVSHGTPQGALDDVIIIPFNNTETALAILNQHANELACVLIDPLPHRVGFIPASLEFVEALRKWTYRNGALLVFDEVITFRSEFGGAQQWFDARADLTAMGKMIGGGFPVGAIAGCGEVMEVLNPLAKKVLFPHSGTFSANPITMTAGFTAMNLFDRKAVAKLNALGDRARKQIADAIRDAKIPACVTGAGSIFRIHMKPGPPKDYRAAFASAEESRLTQALLNHLFDNGIMMINTCSGTLSTPMTENEIDTLTDVLRDGFQKIKTMRAELFSVERQQPAGSLS